MLTKEQKERLRAEEVKVWGADSKMVDFCVNQAAEMIELPGGGIITVDKQKIETRFCFGESGYDYEDAQRQADHARRSKDHFKRENMRSFRDWIESIKEQYQMHRAENPWLPNSILLIRPNKYRKQTDICDLEFRRATDILDALGGSARVSELPGTEIKLYGVEYKIPTRDELDLILFAYERAAAEHEKKIDRYLKRYGTIKVHAWTYWRDA